MLRERWVMRVSGRAGLPLASSHGGVAALELLCADPGPWVVPQNPAVTLAALRGDQTPSMDPPV
jgi:hypothetical protein